MKSKSYILLRGKTLIIGTIILIVAAYLKLEHLRFGRELVWIGVGVSMIGLMLFLNGLFSKPKS